MVYRFMWEHKDQYHIREMARVFGVSSSAYYKWVKKGASEGRSKYGKQVSLKKWPG
jgi:transposase